MGLIERLTNKVVYLDTAPLIYYFEEFFTDKETLDMERFQNLGVIKKL